MVYVACNVQTVISQLKFAYCGGAHKVLKIIIKFKMQTTDRRFIFLICFWWQHFGFYCITFYWLVRIAQVISNAS